MSVYAHAPTVFLSDEEIAESWRHMLDMKRSRLIREIRHGRETGWGDPDELCVIDEFERLPPSFQIEFAKYLRGEE